MTWVAWRQQRLTVVLSLIVMAVLAAAMLYFRVTLSGPLADLPENCLMPGDMSNCPDKAFEAIQNEYLLISYLPMILLALPLVVGILIGAPLFAREAENGTHLLGLTQSVSRVRWWATKLLVTGLPLFVAMLGLGMLAHWALEPVYRIETGYWDTSFASQGLALAGYTLLAIALGASTGLLVKNTVTTIAITLVTFLLLITAVANFARAEYAEPVTDTIPINEDLGPDTPAGGLRVDFGALNADGEEVDTTVLDHRDDCMDGQACYKEIGVVETYTRYHPLSHFWRFQWTEFAVLSLLSAGVLALGVWALRKRLL